MKYTAIYKRGLALTALIACTCLPIGAQAAYQTLQKGDSGELVFRLEEALAMQGYFDAWPDQTYDDATVYGVKAFQTDHNLTADGIAGNQTQTMLYGVLSGDEENENYATGVAASSSVKMPSTLRELSLNKQGNDVSSLQTRLTELGYYTGRISGNYGKMTKSAVEAFQSANGLKADGIAGENTQKKLYADTAIASTGATGSTTGNTTTNAGTASGTAYTTLKAGMESDAVREMQQKLKDLGYYSGSVSGNYGNLTWEAVRAFQRKSGLTADGVAGPKTLEKLYGTTSTGTSGGTQTDTGSTGETGTGSTGASTTTTLKVGASGETVSAMQQKLKDLGYYTGPVTGNFGNVTWEAVRKFQKAKGLTADGVAGSKTLTALYGTSATGGTNSGTGGDTVTVNAALKLGSRGTDVKSLQERLKTLGYLSGSADGVFGTATQTAVIAFQRANSLSADGVVGTGTLNRLNSSSAVAASGSNSSSSTTNDTTQTLKHGMKNVQAVKDMQTQLTKLGYYSSSITGNFGDMTLKAVKAFQSANGLSADGIAGPNTLTRMYSGTAVAAGSSSSGSGSNSGSNSNSNRPNPANVQNVNWYTSIRPYYKAGTVMQIYDFENNLTWQCVMMSNGKHSDSQPRTADDTAIMYKAFGNKTTWTAKAVWITMPDGKTFIGSLHNTPHLSGSIKDNNFDGHLCIHFPRDMDEAEETGPYAVSHQKAILKGWEKTQAMIGK